MQLRISFSLTISTAVLLGLFLAQNAQAQANRSDGGQPLQASPGQYTGPQYQGQFPGQQNQQYPVQQNPAQQYPGQQYPSQQYPGQQYPGQQYPGQQYPGQQYQPQGQSQGQANQGQYPGQHYPGQPTGQYAFPPGQNNGAPGSQPRPQQTAPRKAANPQQAAKVYQWFLSYDEIRRRAQMNPIEKQQADGLLSRGLGLFMPGQDKLAAKQLLSGLVMRYQNATHSLQGLAVVPETRQLQELYFQYFDTAMHLFSDYLVVQDNVFAVDNTGQSVAKQLIQRKMALENLERSCKDLDAQVRQSYGVAAFQY